VRSFFCPGGLLPVKNGNPEVIPRKSEHCRRKAIQLLRHSSFRSTLDVYTQAVTPAKHAAQAAGDVAGLFFR
jgi:hypothetical protein